MPATTYIEALGAGSTVAFVGPRVHATLGYSAEEAQADPGFWWKRLHPGDRERVLAELAESQAADRPFMSEYRVTARDGRELWVHHEAGVVRDQEGVPQCVQGVIVDITDRKLAEQRLRASEAKYRHLLEKVPDAIILFDGETRRIVEANDAVLSMYGYTRDEFLGLSHNQITAEPEESDTSIRQVLRAGSLRIPLRWHRKRDGTVFPVEISADVLTLGENRVVCGVVRDVGARLQAERALEQSERRFRSLIACAGHVILCLDPQHRVVEWNAAAEELYGWKRADALGRDYVATFLPEDAQDAVAADIEKVLRGQTTRAFENAVHTRDGRQRVLVWSCARLTDADGHPSGIIAIGQDVTEQRHAEAEARQRRAELRRMSRMCLMGEMAAGLGHELNQPLSTILFFARGCLRRLRSGRLDDAQIPDVLEKIAEQAERAGAIIHRLRDFARQKPPQQRLLDLNAVIRSLVEFVAFELRDHDVTVRLELQPAVPHVLADRILMEQVLLNLIRNGIDAMAGLRADCRELVVVTETTEDKQVRVCVSDRGRGLSSQDTERVFHPFFTTKAGGTGMGLTISRSIIEAHGGRLWLEPHPDRGVTACFTLPEREYGQWSARRAKSST